MQHAAIALVVAGLRWLSSHVLMDGGGPACLRAVRCAAWFAQQTRRCGTWPPPAESSSRSDNFYEVDVPVKGHRSLQGAPSLHAALAWLLLCTEHGRQHASRRNTVHSGMPLPLLADQGSPPLSPAMCRVTQQPAEPRVDGWRQCVLLRALPGQGESAVTVLLSRIGTSHRGSKPCLVPRQGLPLACPA